MDLGVVATTGELKVYCTKMNKIMVDLCEMGLGCRG